MQELQQKVVQWAADKGLLTNVTPERIEAQTLKVIEEIGETAGAYLKGNREELIDGIGDIAVTIIILAAMREYDLSKSSYIRKDQNYLLSVTECLLFASQGDLPYLGYALTHLKAFALRNNYDLVDCLQSAYDVISKRKGKMVGDTFVKD